MKVSRLNKVYREIDKKYNLVYTTPNDILSSDITPTRNMKILINIGGLSASAVLSLIETFNASDYTHKLNRGIAFSEDTTFEVILNKNSKYNLQLDTSVTIGYIIIYEVIE